MKLSYVLIKANHIAEIPYSLSHRKSTPLILVCPGQKSKEFYTALNLNANYRNVNPVTATQYATQSYEKGSTVLLLQAPQRFEQLQQILNRGQSCDHTVILCLLDQTKKYLNIICKKINHLQVSEMIYSPHRFVGINDKIRSFVDQNFDMNRSAFYAYGEFINLFRANPLKKIFRTELMNLDDLALSYGFASAQRVKDGNFLKPSAQKINKAEARKRRKLAKKNRTALKKQRQIVPSKAQKIQPQTQKAIKKTKKIIKASTKK